ncbi:ABC transporter permease [Chryseosolibacter indicus]|uniref:ABC transporter permease n=1 Tax=Chryseosolibacter indicus TaxID=2782351 RepID=A0ABS5VUS6_9BACT|nr:ABC transporter permease [Chryseosolibacter indicus]MBT1705182.1 ABC transporter permease [Chryseosolibacter indicus]
MIKQNLKLILRNLWINRIYSSAILLSLVTGFVCTNILVSFLVFETNTDTFHSKRDRIFQVFSNDPFGGNGRITFVPRYFFEYLTTNYPEVQNVCQLFDLNGIVVKNGTTKFDDFNVLSVDSSFFTLFDFPLHRGRKDHSLSNNEIVLSKEKALALFGNVNVLGSMLTISTPDTTRELIVSAVVDRPVENSHLYFDALIHHSTLPPQSNGGATYALLTRADAGESLLKKINSDAERPGLIGPGKTEYFFIPLVKSYFSTDNKTSYIKTRNPMFLTVGYVVCGLVFFIASFNFINLFLLSWQNRKKEIGIKKTLGVTRRDLFSFSITEAGVYVFTGFLLSLIITYSIIPVFNNVFEANLSLAYFLNVKIITLIGVVLFFTGMLVVMLSVSKQWKMKPVSLIATNSSKVKFNRLFFTIQFVIAITLAVCSVTIVKQMHYIKNASLGFNRQIIQLDAPGEEFTPALSFLKQKIIQLPDVNNVSVCNGNPIFGNMIVRYDLDNEQFYTPYLFGGDEDYLKALDLKLIAGELPSEKNNGKVVNQKLVKQFDLENPIGDYVPGTQDKIVGVVEDFTCGSFKQDIPPAIISFYKDGRSILIDYRGSNLSTILTKLREAWTSVFPDYSFHHRVIQEELMKKYKEETFFYKIIITFSIISMVLSCFGLFALSWAVVQSRTKEMGIRKVLGATPIDILNLLTLTFTKRIILAFLIAAPVGYYLMNQWLTRFTNKIELDIWIFCISAVMVTFTAFVTLSLQIVRAIMTNPIDEIRND